MAQIVKFLFSYIQSLRLGDKLSPKKNPEIAWFYIFLPSFFFYLSFLLFYFNNKPKVGILQVQSPVFNTIFPKGSKPELLASNFKYVGGLAFLPEDGSGHSFLISDLIEDKIYKWEEGKGFFTIGKSSFANKIGCSLYQLYNQTYENSCSDLVYPGVSGFLEYNLPTSSMKKSYLATTSGDRSIILFGESNDKEGDKLYLLNQYKGKKFNTLSSLTFDSDGNLFFLDSLYGYSTKIKDNNNINNDNNNYNNIKIMNSSGLYMIKKDILNHIILHTEKIKTNTTGIITSLLKSSNFIKLINNDLDSNLNGLAFSPEFSKIYIGSNENNIPIIYSYDMNDNYLLNNKQILFNYHQIYIDTCKQYKLLTNLNDCNNITMINKILTDLDGNIYIGGSRGILVLNSKGDILGEIILPLQDIKNDNKILDISITDMIITSDGYLLFSTSSQVFRIRIKKKQSKSLKL